MTQFMPVTVPGTRAIDTTAQSGSSLLNRTGAVVSTPSLNPGLDFFTRSAGMSGKPVADTGSGSLVLSQLSSITTGIVGSLSGLAGVTTNAVSALASGALSVNPVGTVTRLLGDLLPMNAVIDLKVNGGSFDVGLGQATVPLASAELDSQAANQTTITVVVQGGKNQTGAQGIALEANGAILLSGDIGVNPISSGPILKGNSPLTISGGMSLSLSSGLVSPSTGGDERFAIGPSSFELNVPMPLERDTESGAGVTPNLVRSAATPPMLEHSSAIGFLPLPINSVKGVWIDIAGETESVELDNGGTAVVAHPVASTGGARDTEEGCPIPAPQSEDLLADLLPVDLTSLEADLQAFLEQVEQLGADLAGMLGRMNLSPLLMAVAIAAVAGEIARRRSHRPQPEPLLACCAGAAAGWLPGLTDPWSVVNP